MMRPSQNKAFDFSTAQLRMLSDQTFNLLTLVRCQWQEFYNWQQFPEGSKTQYSSRYPACLFVNIQATMHL
jgi:hypothetical protein